MNSYIELEPGSCSFADDLLSYDYHLDTLIPPNHCPPISASLAHQIISQNPMRAIAEYEQKLAEQSANQIMSEPFVWGCAAHAVLLRDADWEKSITIIPGDYRTKANKTLALQAQAEHKIPVKEKMWHKILEMNHALEKTEIAQRILINGQSEISVFWMDAEFPTIINKARIDWVPNKEGIQANQWVVDYKTCRTLDGWGRTYFWNYGLAVKFAHYVDAVRALYPGVERVGLAYLCQEKEPPYEVRVNLAVARGDPDDILKGMKVARDVYGEQVDIGNRLYELGKKQLHWIKTVWSQCLETGSYPARREIEFLNVGRFSEEWTPPLLSRKIKQNYRRK